MSCAPVAGAAAKNPPGELALAGAKPFCAPVAFELQNMRSPESNVPLTELLSIKLMIGLPPVPDEPLLRTTCIVLAFVLFV